MSKAHAIMWYLNSLANPNAKLPKVTFYEWIEQITDMLIQNHAKLETDTYEFSAHVPLLQKYPKEIEKYSEEHIKSRRNHNNLCNWLYRIKGN